MTGPADLCPHDDIRAACLECLHDPPSTPSKPHAIRTRIAQFDSFCAADRRHEIDVGDEIGLVAGIGPGGTEDWCCRQCYVR